MNKIKKELSKALKRSAKRLKIKSMKKKVLKFLHKSANLALEQVGSFLDTSEPYWLYKYRILNSKQRERLEQLAEIRGESVEQTLNKLPRKVIRHIPRKFGKITLAPIGVEFIDAGVRDGLGYVKLPNGRILYGHLSTDHYCKAYEAIKDLVSPKLTADTYRVAMDVAARYLGGSNSNFGWYKNELLPGKGGTIVEVGAYLGHKTIRFHDQVVGTTGKVLAIEIMPDNCEILRRNVQENGLNDYIEVVWSGVWNSPGEHIVRGKGFQRNSLVEIDEQNLPEVTTVPTDTLDNILENWGVESVDFIDIRTNGAEVEVLRGLDRMLDRVKVIYVATRYSSDGETTHDKCLQILKDRGCLILPQTGSKAIYAVTEKFSNLYKIYRKTKKHSYDS